jgi:hypothetical protein
MFIFFKFIAAYMQQGVQKHFHKALTCAINFAPPVAVNLLGINEHF